MWTTTNTKPLGFEDSQRERERKKLLTERVSNLPQEAINFLANRFVNTD